MRLRLGLLGLAWLLASCATGSRAELSYPSSSAPAPTPTPTATTAPAQTTTPHETTWPPVPTTARRAHVARVVDGDTIVLVGISVGRVESGGRPGRRARLIGIDTPEIYGGTDCYGARASAFTKSQLAGRDVLVDFDVGRLDRYGRALVYVWTTDGVFFNGILTARGYASQMTVPPNVRYAQLFQRYVRDARLARRGLWSAC